MFWKRFNELCLENGASPNGVCKELGFSNATATHWKQGSSPSNNTLKKIADYFNVSVEYLLGETDIKEKALVNKDAELTEYLEELRTRPEMRMLFSLAKGATKEDVQKAVAIIEALRKNDEEN